MSAPARAGLSAIGAKDRFEYLLGIIRDRIIRLEYPPGTRIGEEQLAAEFGVSRTPIRRVLSRLEYEEFVEIRQGSGTYISEIDWDDLIDAYQMRMRLAELIGELNPKAITAGALENLRRIRDEVKGQGYALTPVEYRRWSNEFQHEIDQCIGNRQLRKTINRLYFVTQRHWVAWTPGLDWRVEVDAFHWQIDNTIRCLELNDLRGVGLVWRNTIAGMFCRLTEIRNRDAVPQAAPRGEDAPAKVLRDDRAKATVQ